MLLLIASVSSMNVCMSQGMQGWVQLPVSFGASKMPRNVTPSTETPDQSLSVSGGALRLLHNP